jgi:hypothetical protein
VCCGADVCRFSRLLRDVAVCTGKPHACMQSMVMYVSFCLNLLALLLVMCAALLCSDC